MIILLGEDPTKLPISLSLAFGDEGRQHLSDLGKQKGTGSRE